METGTSYLKLGSAGDLPRGSDDFLLYRTLEILPGALLWGTLALLTVFSWFRPTWVSFFIIAFDVYWLLKTFFFSVHLRASYKRMQSHTTVDWMGRLRLLGTPKNGIPCESWEDIRHLIILPSFREPREILEGALEKIIRGTYPARNMIVVLAIEEAGGETDRANAEALKEKYGHYFEKFLITIHPAELPGELPGKGSNETWAAQRAQKEIIDPMGIPYERIIVSSLDSDTQVYPQYFAVVTYHYLTVSDPLHSSYQPIPVYNNNIWEAHPLSRIVAYSGTFWQMMQQARPERLTTFSSHSMPWKSLVEMKFWNTNIVSEDSRIFWQALLFYDGRWKTVPLFYPVSMDANIGRTWWETAQNIYKQQRRWGWGVENVPYLLFGFFKNRAVPVKTKLYFSFNQLEGFWSWSTNALIIFLFGWLPILLGGEIFNTTVLAYNVPRVTRFLMQVALLGVISSSILSLRILPPLPKGTSWTSYLWIVGQWFLMPFTLIGLGAIPAIDAQTRLMRGQYMGFWRTPKGRTKN